MSMSEFEKQFHSEGDNLFSLSITEPSLPADFNEEDVAFAQELSQLFSPEKEELPPFFVQTLFEAEDPRYTPLDHGFAQKTSARVFRSLKLRRRLFSQQRSVLHSVVGALQEIISRKTLLTWAATLMLIMLFTVAFTAPSFVEGVAMLLHGAPAGVLKVHNYPRVVHHHTPPSYHDPTLPTRINLLAAEQQLHFNIYWPQYMPSNYSLAAIDIYEDPHNNWADGPVVELVYDLDAGNAPLKGTGQIVIREFKPLTQTLQVVQDDAAYPIQPDANGNPRAIYVDGQWLTRGKLAHIWAYGGRSEVIYQQDGVVFWIAGDQRDGIGKKALWAVAQSLHILPFTHPTLLKDAVATLLWAGDTINGPFLNDVVAIFSDNSNPYYLSLSSYISGKPTSLKNPARGH